VRWSTAGPATSYGSDELALARDLALALTSATTQVSLAFQPVRELDGGGIVGAEALVRWQHPAHGPVAAQSMVRLAERTGLIRQLGSLVLDRALAETVQARESFGPGFRMHVNVSPFELREPGYVDTVSAALARHGVPPAALLLELTETALMTSESDIISVLADLRAVGVEIGIDDFGTGYSSIARLHRMPVDTVKLDRSLIAGIGTSPVEFDLVRAVFRLLETSGVRVVAEGVETAVQVAHLRALGCRLGQGLLLGPPAPAVVPTPA
jgi:EAL domain-containing protein (putative c-di-GMP-specific phosphodiesterase class I)